MKKRTGNDNRPDAECLTVTQLMRRWQCTRKVILAAVDRGELAVFRVGNHAYRVTLAEVERYETTWKRARPTEAA